MKKLSLTLTLVLTAASAFAQNATMVRWHQIAGVITAPGTDNPVGSAASQIHSGAGPWTARGGSASVNLLSGQGSLEVEGLVLNGGNATGTPGGVTHVMGTLVCNPGTPNQVIVDTPATDLSPTGNAELSFNLGVPAQCDNPLFLIRVPAGRWIATGAVRVISNGPAW